MIGALSRVRERSRGSARCRSQWCAAALVAFCASVLPAAAAEYPLAPGQKVVGQIGEYVVQPGEGLNEIARKFDLGYTALAAANPGVDQFEPGAGRRLIIPSLYVLPDAPHQGIVINLAQWRLFYFPPGGDRVETYPLGLSVFGSKTPLGATSVVRKEPNPTWYPPPSIRAERPELPAMIPPGPENPLGDYALHLGWPRYLVHGTNKPDGVGRNVSHGCVRMYPADIERLFSEVSVGTPVRTVNQSAGAGWSEDGGLFVKVFPSKNQVEQIDIDSPVSSEPADGVDRMVRAAAGNYADAVDWDAVLQAARERTGIPVRVADKSGVARDRTRPDYSREAARSYYDRGADGRSDAAGRSYDRGAAGSSYAPAYGTATPYSSYDRDLAGPTYDRDTAGPSSAPDYGRGAAYPGYAPPAYYGRSPAQSYLPYNAPPPEQWGSAPSPYANPGGSGRYGPYPWSGSSAW
jgi:L,D-transpeptidase ErfK/SrfK